MLPETILQFGSGKFLRGFVDYFVHQANAAGQNVGRIVVAQSTGGHRADLLNQQGGRYHVVVRGIHDGKTIDQAKVRAALQPYLRGSERKTEMLFDARGVSWETVIQIQDAARSAGVQKIHYKAVQ